MNDKIRKEILFYGRVQGVGFRYYAKHGADAFGLTGNIENLYDGSVRMEVQGLSEDIDRLIAFLRQQRFIEIDSMDVKSLPLEESEYSFTVKDSW